MVINEEWMRFMWNVFVMRCVGLLMLMNVGGGVMYINYCINMLLDEVFEFYEYYILIF